MDLSGQRFGHLTVTGRAGVTHSGHRRRTVWACRCDCGERVTVLGDNIRKAKYCSLRCPTQWSGTAGYRAIHERLKTHRGKASDYACVECGEPAAEWAYDHHDPAERIGRSGPSEVLYSLNLEHYQPMCRPCHRVFDMAVA